jgi:hypothetical protein
VGSHTQYKKGTKLISIDEIAIFYDAVTRMAAASCADCVNCADSAGEVAPGAQFQPRMQGRPSVDGRALEKALQHGAPLQPVDIGRYLGIFGADLAFVLGEACVAGAQNGQSISVSRAIQSFRYQAVTVRFRPVFFAA